MILLRVVQTFHPHGNEPAGKNKEVDACGRKIRPRCACVPRRLGRTNIIYICIFRRFSGEAKHASECLTIVNCERPSQAWEVAFLSE